MLGKRARQIQRTTSMSQLSPRSTFNEKDPFSSLEDSNLLPWSPRCAAGGQTFATALDDRQDQSAPLHMVETVENESDMEVNMDQIAGHCDDLHSEQGWVTSDHVEECHPSLDKLTEKSPCAPSQTGSWPHHTVPVTLQAKHQDGTSILPAEFLKRCFFCNRRLGHGQDTYIYRGEIAFCSEDCRNHQISKDERKDKCSISASKTGSGPTALNIERGGKVVSRPAVGA